MKKIIFYISLFFFCSQLVFAADKKGMDLGVKFSYGIPAGDYRDVFQPAPEAGLIAGWYPSLDFLSWEGMLGVRKYEFNSGGRSALFCADLAAGPVLYKKIHPFFQPFAGISGGIRFLKFSFKGINEDRSYIRPLLAAKGGFIISLLRFMDLRCEGAYSINRFSSKWFENYSLGLSVLYKTGEI